MDSFKDLKNKIPELMELIEIAENSQSTKELKILSMQLFYGLHKAKSQIDFLEMRIENKLFKTIHKN